MRSLQTQTRVAVPAASQGGGQESALEPGGEGGQEIVDDGVGTVLARHAEAEDDVLQGAEAVAQLEDRQAVPSERGGWAPRAIVELHLGHAALPVPAVPAALLREPHGTRGEEDDVLPVVPPGGA